jgi:hypothetical protein
MCQALGEIGQCTAGMRQDDLEIGILCLQPLLIGSEAVRAIHADSR